MDIVVNFLFALFLMTLAGSVLSLVWSLFCRLFEKFCETPFLYYGLRMILLALLLPVMYIGLFLKTVNLVTGEMDGSAFLITRSMEEWAMVLGMIWLAGAVVSIVLYAREEVLWRCLRKKEREAENEWAELLEQCRAQMGIRRPVKLYLSEWAPTAFTSGGRRPAIWLPAGYGKAEYETMLFHELAHIRHGDIFWDRCLLAARILHWFNPLVHYLARQVSEWEEYYADDTAMAYVEDRKVYGDLLIQQSQRKEATGLDSDHRRFFAKKIVKERIRKIFREER